MVARHRPHRQPNRLAEWQSFKRRWFIARIRQVAEEGNCIDSRGRV
jgi:hypothetical protein